MGLVKLSEVAVLSEFDDTAQVVVTQEAEDGQGNETVQLRRMSVDDLVSASMPTASYDQTSNSLTITFPV